MDHGDPPSARGDVIEVERDELLLDGRDGASLFGRVAPVLPSSDAERILTLRSDRSGPLGDALDGLTALDARFVGSGAAVLGTDRVLRFYGADGRAVALDRDAYGPLSVAGDVVAYVTGAPPDLELARADVHTGAVEQLTRGMAPVWSPALSPDGDEVVFVSGLAGSPRMFHLDATGAMELLTETGRVPSAPTAPRWRGSTLIFEDEGGIAFFDLDREVIAEALPNARALATRPDGALVAAVDGRLEAVERLGGAR